MPSAKKAFSGSPLKFSNGSTATDFSSFRAEARGRTKKPVAIETISPNAASMITLRRLRADEAPPCGGAFRCSLDSSRSNTERPCEDEGHGETSQNKYDQKPEALGRSHAGNTADAIWMMKPPATT